MYRYYTHLFVFPLYRVAEDGVGVDDEEVDEIEGDAETESEEPLCEEEDYEGSISLSSLGDGVDEVDVDDSDED